MGEPYDYWQVALADEDEDAQDAEMAREIAGSMFVAALVVLITGGVLCAGVAYAALRMWAA